jgi:hypothetical protein
MCGEAERFNQRANPLQTNPRQTNQIQAKILGLAWFYSSKSGLFKGLQPIQIKKSWLPVQVVRAITYLVPVRSSP